MSITRFQARLLNINKKEDYLYLFLIGVFPLIFSYIIGVNNSVELVDRQGKILFTYRGYWSSYNWSFFFLLLPLALYLLRIIANNLFGVYSGSSPILNYFEGRKNKVRVFIKSRLQKIALDRRITISILFLDTVFHIFDTWQGIGHYISYYKNPSYAPSTVNRVELDWGLFFTIENFAKENSLQVLDKHIHGININLNLLFKLSADFCQFIIVFMSWTAVALTLLYNLFYLQLIYQRKRVSEERIEYHIVLNLDDPARRFGLASMDGGFNLQIFILCVAGILMWASRYINVNPEYYSLGSVAKEIAGLHWSKGILVVEDFFKILWKIPLNKLLPDPGQIALLLVWLIGFFIVILPSFAKFLPYIYLSHGLTPTEPEYLREFIPPKDEESKYKLDTSENLSATRKKFKNNDVWPIGDNYAFLFFCGVFFVALSLLIPLNFNLKELSNSINLIFVISISVSLSWLLLKGLRYAESFLLPDDKPDQKK